MRVRGVGCLCLIFCIAPRLRGVCFFPCFFVSPRGTKSPEIFFQKTPRYRGKRPRACFFVLFQIQSSTAPGGVYSHYYGNTGYGHIGSICTDCCVRWSNYFTEADSAPPRTSDQQSHAIHSSSLTTINTMRAFIVSSEKDSGFPPLVDSPRVVRTHRDYRRLL